MGATISFFDPEDQSIREHIKKVPIVELSTNLRNTSIIDGIFLLEVKKELEEKHQDFVFINFKFDKLYSEFSGLSFFMLDKAYYKSPIVDGY